MSMCVCAQIAGEPLDQTVFQYGPFVMTNRQEIQDTLMDCKFVQRNKIFALLTSFLVDQTGKNGFEKAHTWKSKIAHAQ